MRICTICGKEFFLKRYDANQCSRECYKEYRKQYNREYQNWYYHKFISKKNKRGDCQDLEDVV